MSHDQAMQDSTGIDDDYQEQICKLKERLISYEEILAEKVQLLGQLNDLKRWVKNVKHKEKQMNSDLLNNSDIQIKRLKEAEEFKAILQAENKELLKNIDLKTEQICTLKQIEENLLKVMEESKMNKKKIKNEFYEAKSQIKESNFTIERLTKALKCKEEEYFDVKKQLDECRAESCRQSETCRDLEKELETTNTKLTDAKFQLKLMEEKTRMEREALSSELEIMCQRRRTIQIECNDVRGAIDEEKSNVHVLQTQVVNLRQANEKDRCEANTQNQRLKKDNSEKDENACQIKNQISQLTRENESISSDNCMLKTQLHGKKILLDKMKQAIEFLEQTKNNQIAQLERDKNALECAVQQKKETIEKLEQEMHSFREQIKEIELNKFVQSNEKEKCCLEKKIEELESKYNSNNNYRLFTKCESIMCSSQDKDSEEEQDSKNCCPSNQSKCSPSTNNDGNDSVDNSCIIRNLKQMYCKLEQFKETHLINN